MTNLFAIIDKFGPQALPLIQYLLANTNNLEQIIEFFTVLLPLFGITPTTSKTAISDDEFIAVCKRAGASTGDAQELMAVMPE